MKFFTIKRSIHKKIIGATFLLGLLSFNTIAQEKSQFLKLKDAIDTAVANNSAMQTGKIDEAIALEKAKQVNAAFLPKFNLSYTAFTTNNPLNAFGFKLQQSEITQADFNPDLLNHPSQTNDFTTKLDAQQPLFNLDAIYLKKSANAQTESYQFKTKRTQEYLTLETQKAYYQLQMAQEVVLVLEEALSTAKSAYEFTNNRVSQGLVQKSDLLNVEVMVLGIESNLNEPKANLFNASDYLSVLMNKPTGILYTVEKLSATNQKENILLKLPENRSDFLAMEKAIKATDYMSKSFQTKFVPRVNMFGSYQLNDKKFAGFGADSYFAGVQLSWSIFNGTSDKRQAKGIKLEQQKMDVQLRSMKQENQMQLDKYERDLDNASFKIKQQKVAIAQATEALRIIQNRYEEGLVNTTDVLNAQTQLSQQKLMLLNTMFNNQLTQANIQFLTTPNSQK
ncbi:MAG TPA: TolC family protein [Pelobium sp.]|nr:TolC family protein [Pelobium sp.]